MEGYCGKILQVNLTTGEIEGKELDAMTARKFLGDFGISLRLAYDLLKPGIDPLSPANVIIVSAGPLVGTKTPSAVRSSILTKYPLTGAIAFANTGMGLGKRLKSAGYDHLIITGRADQPVYLKISDIDVQICSAKHLWGKDIYQTTDELWQELGNMYSIVAIGQAGENLVKASVALIDKIASAGKGGLPAVMGSKNLKAIAIGGNKRVEVFAPNRFEELITSLLDTIRQDPERRGYTKFSKMSRFDAFAKLGIPYKNRTEVYPKDDFSRTYGVEAYLKVRGSVSAPCSQACPAGVDVPRFSRFVADGKFAKAVAVLREKIPFPLVCGHTCAHFCEAKCQRGDADEPVAIRMLHRVAAEHDTGQWKLNSKIAPSTNKRVAVIGSGPAGLTAAYYLAKLGHSVSVFEALPEPGGMMRFGIPDYRLPKDILKAEADEIKNVGVTIRTNIRVKSPQSLLREGYHAIFVAIGAHQPITMGIEGEDNPKVKECISFLRDINLGRKVKLGNRVAIIGGGNAAIDSARTALRVGAKEVTIVYRRTRPEMPATTEEIEVALAEGIKIDFLTGPSKIIEQDGELKLECVRMKLGSVDATGRPRPEPVEGSEFTISFNNIIMCIGQRPQIPDQFGLATGGGNRIKVDPTTLATSGEGIFAGGDATTGPTSIVQAIAAGRRAAISIDKYMGGRGDIDEMLAPPEEETALLEDVEIGGRTQLRTLPPDQRIRSFARVELGLRDEEAIEEARRCLRCDIRVGCPGCLYPCKDALEIKEGEYEGLTTNVSSLIGRLEDFGVRCNVGSFERVAKCVDLANRYGVDSHIFAPVMDLAVELYERGIITKEDTEGLVLKRDVDTTLKLIEMVALRQGIGDVLADGSLGLIKRFGSLCENYSSHIKGIPSQTDARPRQLTGKAFGQIVNPEGGGLQTADGLDLRVVTRSGVVSPERPQGAVEAYCNRIGVPKDAMGGILYQLGYNVGRLTKYAQDFYAVLTSLGICQYREKLLSIYQLAELYEATTGIKMSPSDLREAGERVWNLFKMINVREGFSRKDDRIPARWLEPLKANGEKDIPLLDCKGDVLSAGDIDKLLDDYYEERGWEVQRGIPTKEKLTDLGLAEMTCDKGGDMGDTTSVLA